MESDPNGRLLPAGDALRGVISHYYHIFYPGPGPALTKHLSPSLEMMLVINLGSPTAISFQGESTGGGIIDRVAIIGPLRKMLNYELESGADALVVNFELDGFYRCFQLSPTEASSYEWTESYFLTELADELQNHDITERVGLLNDFFISLLQEKDEAVMPLLAGEHYFHNPALQPAKAIASDAGVTQRAIQIRFQKYAGYSPKELLRFLRFKAVINHLLQKEHKFDVFEIISLYQYHDQSHLIKDFKFYLGVTPKQFFKTLKGRQFYITGQDKS